jgi:hypothetical protein
MAKLAMTNCKYQVHVKGTVALDGFLANLSRIERENIHVVPLFTEILLYFSPCSIYAESYIFKDY